jgi:hypothetical protein
MYSTVGVVVDETLDREARRKARGSVHPRTGKRVDQSHQELKFVSSLYGGATATFSLTAPPQPDQTAIFDLSKLHFIAFMYWLTYDDRSREGRFGTGVFAPIGYALRSDWGNARLRAFMEAVVGWEPRALGDCASGYFRVAIRKHPEAVCWSWAMEWNKNVRIAGFMGDETVAQELVDALPRPQATVIERSGSDYKALRLEQALAEADDAMFHWSPRDSEPEPPSSPGAASLL